MPRVALPLAVNPLVTVIDRQVTGVATRNGAARSTSVRCGEMGDAGRERGGVGCSPHRGGRAVVRRVDSEEVPSWE